MEPDPKFNLDIGSGYEISIWFRKAKAVVLQCYVTELIDRNNAIIASIGLKNGRR